MKNIISLTTFLFYLTISFTQVSVYSLAPESTENHDTKSEDLSLGYPEISVSGLASVNGITTEELQTPSTNIAVQFFLAEHKSFVIAPSFNFGSKVEVLEKDSIQLTSLLFPDASSLAFNIQAKYDFMPLICSAIETNPYIRPVTNALKDKTKIIYHTFQLYAEYSYQFRNINFKDSILEDGNYISHSTIQPLETNILTIGLRFSREYLIDDNQFGIGFNCFNRFNMISDNSINTYNDLFAVPVFIGNEVLIANLPRRINTWNFNPYLRIGNAYLNFTITTLCKNTSDKFQGLLNKNIFTLSANIGTSFLEFGK